MPAGSEDIGHVVLPSGWCVPLPVLELLLDLEARQFHITADADGLIVSPKSKLTDADSDGIKRHRDALLMLVREFEAVQ